MSSMGSFKPFALASMAVALALVAVPHAGSPLSAFALASSAPLLPINPNNWIPVAFAAVLMVMAVAAFVYVLAGIINSAKARAWAQSQIYEAALSIVLLLVFLFFIYLFYINPVKAFSNAGLVPSNGNVADCTSVNTLFTLAACDMFYFNQNALYATETVYVLAFFGGFSPGISISVSTIPKIDGVNVEATLPDFVPVQEEQLLTAAFSGLFFALILNQLQSIMVGGALLWLSLFLVAGLVARTFGITRTFGGSLIAFGLGLGLVYPLLVALTYGFINVNVGFIDVAGSLGNIIPLLFSAILAILSGQTGNAGLVIFNSQFVTQIAYVVAGLTFIPLLNFTILDAFIRDFSRLIGQQIDFMSLMGGLI